MDDGVKFRAAATGGGTEAGSMIKVSVLVPRSLHSDFITVLPQSGAIAWVVRAAMESLVSILREEPSLRHRLEVAMRRRIGEMPDYLVMPKPQAIEELGDE